MTTLTFNLNYRDPSTSLLTSNPVAATGTLFAKADWQDGILIPPSIVTGADWGLSVDGTSTAVVDSGSLKLNWILPQEGNDIVLGIGYPMVTNEVYAEFDAKFEGTPHAIKFYKIHGKTGSGYANSTYGVDGGGEISRFSFGDGSTTTNDTANILLYSGANPELIGRSYGTATIQTPQNSSFPGSMWNNGWHHFRIHHRFNSGTSALNEVPDGEMYIEIDGLVYGHITNMFNRHWSNQGIEYMSFADVAQDADYGFTLRYDNIKMSIGGWVA